MDNFHFARRTQWSQQVNALNLALEELKKQQIPIVDLTASNPTECGFFYPADLLGVLTQPENLQYHPDACGTHKARAAVAKYYNFPSDQVVLTASTSEAYSFLMRLLVNPGEKVLVPAPSYPLFQFLLEINDVAFDYYPLEYDGNRWSLDLKALEDLIDVKTRAIILVNPNNPTGSYLNQAELNGLNQICQKHRMSIISDEVFWHYHFNEGNLASCVGNHSVLTFTLGGLSKSMALPQMKCAWILSSGPQVVLNEALSRLEIIADTYLSVNTPVQNALNQWFGMAPKIQEQIKERTKANYQWLSDQMHLHSSSLLAVQGGWYATLRIPAVKSEEEWVLEFLREEHLLVYPGYFFDFDKEAYMIVSLLPETDIFKEGIRRLKNRLKPYN